MKKLIIVILMFFCYFHASPQKVGLVLSGGGAKGLAHISVIRVLEENNIPIDYVTGTSIGAIVAGLYAAGYTTQEMEELFRSDDFYFWSTGQIQEEYRYYFKRGEENPSWIEVKMEKRDDKLKLFPPTNIVPQWQMDFAFMELTAASSAVAKGDFDRLFVPFRCVATDVTRNLPVVLSSGDLGEAIRASMTFPFIFKPIEIDGNLLFDGGIVNNFPQDVMMDTFHPDIIIGHKVVDDHKPAAADDILLQITNMIQRPTNYQIPPEKGILLETKLDEVGVMDFAKIDFVMEAGFKTINPMIDSIKTRIKRRSDPVALERRREVFNSRKPALLFQNIQVEGVKDALQTKYIINSIKHAKNVFTTDVFKKEYFKLIADNQIKSIRPLAIFNEGSGYFDVHLKVETEKRTEIKVGGNISTKPINQGFVNFDYRLFRNRAYTLSSNLYFGRFYNSFKLGGRIDFPTTRPLYFVSYLTYNRWDYFSSSNELFFENVRPPFIIQNESSFRNEIGVPLGLHDKFSTGISWSGSRDEYYQKEKFLKEDIPDKTDFNASIIHIEYEKNSLNRIQYATEGMFRNVSGRFIAGLEKNIPGTTSVTQESLSNSKSHGYFQFKYTSSHYFPVSRSFTLGTHIESVLSDKRNFRNYTSSMLSAPSFNPTPYSKTLFMENFRANNFLAGGLKGIYHLNPQLHFRLEGYGFLPIHELQKTETLEAERDRLFIRNYYFQGMAALVMDMGVGPLSLALNYYDKANTKWFFSLNFGFITFNKRGF